MEEKVIRYFELGLASEKETEEELLRIKDYPEVINWYLYFIHVKSVRAIDGLIEDDGWEIENGFQRDYDGTAKIAHIAVKRSLQAWGYMLKKELLRADELISILALLQKILRQIGELFPEAENFIRPGFDTPETN